MFAKVATNWVPMRVDLGCEPPMMFVYPNGRRTTIVYSLLMLLRTVLSLGSPAAFKSGGAFLRRRRRHHL